MSFIFSSKVQSSFFIQIKEEFFHDAESMFDRVSEGATSKINKMLKKYHLLCLKDAAVSCFQYFNDLCMDLGVES